MQMNSLSLNALGALQKQLTLLHDMGLALWQAGKEPRFDLTPGQTNAISFPPLFELAPVAPAAAEGWREPIVQDAVQECAPDPEAVTQPVAELRAEPPPEAGAGPASGKPLKWSAEEDAKAVALFRAAPAEASFDQKAKLIAAELGRPVGGVEFRLRRTLADRIAEKQAKPAVTLAPAPVAAVTMAEPLRPVSADQLEHHILTLRRGAGHQVADDLEMMKAICDNIDTNTVAGIIGKDAAEVKRRFDALTGVYKDGNDKTCRKFSREQVLACLRRLMGANGAAA